MSFKAGGSKSRNASSAGLAYARNSINAYGQNTPGMIEAGKQEGLNNLRAMFAQLASQSQQQGMQYGNSAVPGAVNSFGNQMALQSVAPAMQMQQGIISDATQQQLAMEQLLGQMGLQYAGLTGSSKSKNPGLGYTMAGGFAGGLGQGLGYAAGK